MIATSSSPVDRLRPPPIRPMDFAGVPFRECVIAGYGHQDCLIGRHAARDVFPHISAFLQ